MDMNEKLLTDYLTKTRRWTYSDFDIKDIKVLGHMVVCREVSVGGHYSDIHEIPLLDIMAWIYSEVV